MSAVPSPAIERASADYLANTSGTPAYLAPYKWSAGTNEGYQCDSDLYTAYRLFGTPGNTRITQGQGGDLPPVRRLVLDATGKPVLTNQFVNITQLQAAVDGRTNISGDPTVFHDETASGFMPASNWGFIGGLPRPEDTLGTTTGWGMDACGGELPNPRVFAGGMVVPNVMNLAPISEYESIRAENAKRLNGISHAVALSQLRQAGYIQ